MALALLFVSKCPTEAHVELPSIASADLDTVVGGAYAAGDTGDAQVTAALARITDSLNSPQDQRSSSGEHLAAFTDDAHEPRPRRRWPRWSTGLKRRSPCDAS